ncbi:hypothetical protein [Planctellipticum variicoloris]|uniref:hypothetical protein n=1 Tax=Planctellipticum variicoloris TaxID=3064265 RepID=UPI00301414FE|nr:hypothetical protein SH412_003744 [Planctomycetaceae bacterium SH412]
MRHGFLWVTLLAMAGANLSGSALAQQPKQPPATGAQAMIDQAAQDGKYTFLMFYKQKDAASNAMATTLKDAVAGKSEQVVAAYVQVGNPGDQALVAKYDVSRAPMPMIIALAPNGAMTGMFAQKVTAETLSEAFVTPTMMFAMKNLQENKLVLVTVQGLAKAPAPVAIKDFQGDPHFKGRIVTASMSADDPREGKFVGQMQIDSKAKATHTVLLAPPGVMVGKFDAGASKDEIAAALAKAGKCCDDPNCKHHQHAPAQRTATPSSSTRRN